MLNKFNALVLDKTLELNNQLLASGTDDVGQCGFAESRIFFGRKSADKKLLLSLGVIEKDQYTYCNKTFYVIYVASEFRPRLRNQTRAYAIQCEKIILECAIEVFGLEIYETSVYSWID